MIVPRQNKSFGIFFFFLILMATFALTYYKSATSDVKPYQLFREKYRNQLIPAAETPEPKLAKNQVHLKKNEKFIMNKTCIVFKGLSKKTVEIDLYLMELDPNVPYALNFTKESVSDGIWLGNVQYGLVSVSENILRLKILDSYSTR